MGFSDCCSISNLLKTAEFAIPASLGSGAVSWLGRSITNAGFLHGLGFGAVVGAITWAVTPILEKKFDNVAISLGISTVLGGAVAYGLSAGAAALGIVAAPITVPGALILTISSLAFGLFGLFVEDYIGDCCKKEKFSREDRAYQVHNLSIEAQRAALLRNEEQRREEYPLSSTV